MLPNPIDEDLMLAYHRETIAAFEAHAAHAWGAAPCLRATPWTARLRCELGAALVRFGARLQGADAAAFAALHPRPDRAAGA